MNNSEGKPTASTTQVVVGDVSNALRVAGGLQIIAGAALLLAGYGLALFLILPGIPLALQHPRLTSGLLTIGEQVCGLHQRVCRRGGFVKWTMFPITFATCGTNTFASSVLNRHVAASLMMGFYSLAGMLFFYVAIWSFALLVVTSMVLGGVAILVGALLIQTGRLDPKDFPRHIWRIFRRSRDIGFAAGQALARLLVPQGETNEAPVSENDARRQSGTHAPPHDQL